MSTEVLATATAARDLGLQELGPQDDMENVPKTSLFSSNVSTSCFAKGQICCRLTLISLLSLWLQLNDVGFLCCKSLFSL